MKAFIISLILLLSLGVATPVKANHYLPVGQFPPGEMQIILPSNPIVMLMSRIVHSLYMDHISGNQNGGYPVIEQVVVLRGSAARIFEARCNCVGFFVLSEPKTIIVVVDSAISTTYIVAHELAHVVQFNTGRTDFVPVPLLEAEADWIGHAAESILEGNIDVDASQNNEARQ